MVVGVVETHGRKETEALLDGFEILPRKPTVYVNRILDEFDIDAALKRRPSLILVDELAHTNVPGSRHPKRYQDVEELLDAGIDVYTTVNIQHIESLNDVVAQITRVRVREIVPDDILDRADAIKLVDLTPDELIERLKEGKVYVPGQAERALKHYFSPANLTALRELALRRTAERVDEQLLEQMQARAIPGPWAAGERILVCVSEDPRSAGLVRYAKRLADRLHAPWSALCVETSRSLQLNAEERDRIADALRLAERLDGEAVTVPLKARRIADNVIGFAQRHNVTHIIVGKSTRSRWFEIVHGSVVHDLVRRAGNISVHVIAGEELAAQESARPAVATALPRSFAPKPYVVALAAVAAALAMSLVLRPSLGIENVDLLFLTAIVGVAVRYGLWPSLAATVAASLCYNFFFLPPVHTFTVTDPTNIAAFILFTVLAVAVSNLAGRGRSQTVTALQRVRSIESLYAFSRKLAGAGTLDDVLWATAHQIAAMLKVRVVLLLPDKGSIAVEGGFPPEDRLDEADLAAAKWAWEQSRPAGRELRCAAGRQVAVPADADRPRADRHRRHLQGRGGAAAARRAAAPPRCAGRPGRLGDRAGTSRGGHRAGAAGGRYRPAALGAAHLDLPRPQDTAGGGSRRGGGAARPAKVPRRGGQGRPPGHHHRRIRAAQPLHRQPARHDEAGIGRRCARIWRPTISARSSAAPWSALRRSSQGIASRSQSPPICPWSR